MSKGKLAGIIVVCIIVVIVAVVVIPEIMDRTPASQSTPSSTEPTTPSSTEPTTPSPKIYHRLSEVIIEYLRAGPQPDRTPKSEFETQTEYESRCAESDAQWRVEARSYFRTADEVSYVLVETDVWLPDYDAENSRFEPIVKRFEANGDGHELDDWPYFILVVPAGVEVRSYDFGRTYASNHGWVWVGFTASVRADRGQEIRDSEPDSIRMYLRISAPNDFYYYCTSKECVTDNTQDNPITITMTKAELIGKDGEVVYTW